MTLKTCPCCKKTITSKTAEKKGRDKVALYFNCKNCHSTFILRSKNWESLLSPETATIVHKFKHLPVNKMYRFHNFLEAQKGRKLNSFELMDLLQGNGFEKEFEAFKKTNEYYTLIDSQEVLK